MNTKEVAKKTSSSGMGVSTTLVIIFVVLKAVGVVDWSWWWVFSPWWITAGIALAFYVVLFSFIGIAFTIVTYLKNKNK